MSKIKNKMQKLLLEHHVLNDCMCWHTISAEKEVHVLYVAHVPQAASICLCTVCTICSIVCITKLMKQVMESNNIFTCKKKKKSYFILFWPMKLKKKNITNNVRHNEKLWEIMLQFCDIKSKLKFCHTSYWYCLYWMWAAWCKINK